LGAQWLGPGTIEAARRHHGQGIEETGHSAEGALCLDLWRERAMWWLLILIVVALIAGMVVALSRRGHGDPNFRPDDPRHGEQLGGPGGQWGPGGDGGF